MAAYLSGASLFNMAAQKSTILCRFEINCFNSFRKVFNVVDKAPRGEINSTVLKEYTILTSNFCGLIMALTTVVMSVWSSRGSSISIGLLLESII